MPRPLHRLVILVSTLFVLFLCARADERKGAISLRLHLLDGANFSGTPITNSLTVITSYARIAVPFADVQSIVPEKNLAVSVVFPNGDVLKGTSSVDRIRFRTEFGTMAIELRHIKTLAAPANARWPEWINDGLVAYYRFDGDANDSGSNGYHGSVHGAEPATDRFNNPRRSYWITDRNFIMLNNKAVTGLRSFTISAWVHFDELHTGSGNPGNTIISVSTRGSVNELVFAHGLAGTGLGMNLKGEDQGWYDSGGTDVRQRTWYHIVMTRYRSNVAIYLDGKEVGSTIASPAPLLADYTGVIVGQEQDSVGGGFQSYQSLDGKIDDLRIYNRALTPVSVRQLHAAEKREY